MGELELESSKRTRDARIRRAIFSTVKVAAILTLAVAAPNTLGAFKKLGIIPSERQSESLKRSYRRLLKSGHLKYEGAYLRLTSKGEQELQILEMHHRLTGHKPRWDNKWRVLIFDIPERRRKLRDAMRISLQGIGFRRLQDSVWVYPYDCEDLITLLKADRKIGRDLLYLIVDQIEGDRWLKEEFNL